MSDRVTTQQQEDGQWTYTIDDRAPSRLWLTQEKAQAAGEDVVYFEETGVARITEVPVTGTLKPRVKQPDGFTDGS